MSRYVTIPGGRDAYEQGLRLRERGLSYAAICAVLAEYHGVKASPDSMRYALRRRGAAPLAPRGITAQQRQAA